MATRMHTEVICAWIFMERAEYDWEDEKGIIFGDGIRCIDNAGNE